MMTGYQSGYFQTLTLKSSEEIRTSPLSRWARSMWPNVIRWQIELYLIPSFVQLWDAHLLCDVNHGNSDRSPVFEIWTVLRHLRIFQGEFWVRWIAHCQNSRSPWKFMFKPDENLCLSLILIHLLISARPSRSAGLISIPGIVPTFCMSFPYT
jgi:hypothetical protein